MSSGALHVFWQNLPVGMIEEPSVDNFHLFGRWVSNDSEPAKHFLESVAAISDGEHEVWVTCGTGVPELRGTVEALGTEPPSTAPEIEITLR